MIVYKTASALALAASLSLVASAMAADWMIDSAHSTIAFSCTQTDKPFSGHFGSFDGKTEELSHDHARHA